MKKYFILFGFLLISLSVLADDTQISNSLVPKNQQPEIKAGVYSNALRAVNKCRKADLVNVSVTSKVNDMIKDRKGKMVSGEWTEEWTVNACGVDVVVPISLKQNLTEFNNSKNRIHSSYYLKYKFAPVRLND